MQKVELTKENKQLIKYLMVGGWNTLFGILFYTMLIKLFGEEHYLLLSIFSNIVAISQSYTSYKIIVFKTKGHILKEYIKCYGVYGITFLAGLVLMYIFVDKLSISAVASNIVVTLLLTIISYLGHRNFTFHNS